MWKSSCHPVCPTNSLSQFQKRLSPAAGAAWLSLAVIMQRTMCLLPTTTVFEYRPPDLVFRELPTGKQHPSLQVRARKGLLFIDCDHVIM